MGAKGIIVLATAVRDLVPAIHAVYRGHWYLSYQWRKTLEHGVPLDQEDQEMLARLTPREWQVFRLLALGCSTAEVAAALDIARKTVSAHRSHLLNKLRLKNNAHLACLAVELGVLHA
jgi:DNA-binding NarL/FixJ family response regulator